MKKVARPISGVFFTVILASMATLLPGCSADSKPPVKDVVAKPEKMDIRVARDIEKLVKFVLDNKGRINDTILLSQDSVAAIIYKGNEYRPIWTSDENFLPAADSLFAVIENCEYFGLFPSDYHYRAIAGNRLLMQDSVAKTDAVLWSRADLMLTDAFLQIARHLKEGRLDRDSITLRKDTVYPASYYESLIRRGTYPGGRLQETLAGLEPTIPQYDSLKQGLRQFLDSVRPFKRYTHLSYPYTDSIDFYKQLQLRLFEEDILVSPSDSLTAAAWTDAINKYQKKIGIKPTGKLSAAMVNSLNNTNWEKFKQIALNLDRFKMLPDSMPERYLWANIPSFSLELRDADSVVFTSKIVVGKSNTRTPLLSGAITNMVTYPQWSIPTSIVVKEIIPGMRKDTNYLTKHGYVIVNGDGQEVPPSSINWRKYNKGLPYRVIQGSGDENALGIMKFNFNNKYSVYLHDTNQRYLFARQDRALSHGCVRLQQWKKLAFFLLEQDSLATTGEFSTADSVRAWLARKEKHWVPVKKKMPLYIRYFTCEGRNGRVKFYNDVYEEDSLLRDRYFADKPVQ